MNAEEIEKRIGEIEKERQDNLKDYLNAGEDERNILAAVNVEKILRIKDLQKILEHYHKHQKSISDEYFRDENKNKLISKFMGQYGDSEMAKEKANSFGVGFSKAWELILTQLSAPKQTESKWISVDSETPPNKTERYLVVRSGVVTIETWFYRDNEGYWFNYLGITKWQPLPTE